MKRAIGLEHLTLLEIAPPELVTLAAAAGFDTVGLRVCPVTVGRGGMAAVPGVAHAGGDPAAVRR